MADTSRMGSRRRGSGTHMHRGLGAGNWRAPVAVPAVGQIMEGCAHG